MCQGSVISVLSPHNKDLKQRTLKPSAHHSSQRVLQCRITVQFYLESKGKYILARGERDRWPCGSSFYMSFPPPKPALCKLGQPGMLFVSPEVLTPVLRPSFCSIFTGFSLPCLSATAIWTPFSYSNYLTFPPQKMGGQILWE